MSHVRRLLAIALLIASVVGCTQPPGGGAPSGAPATPSAEDGYTY